MFSLSYLFISKVIVLSNVSLSSSGVSLKKVYAGPCKKYFTICILLSLACGTLCISMKDRILSTHSLIFWPSLPENGDGAFVLKSGAAGAM